jgi:ribosome modulation factor
MAAETQEYKLVLDRVAEIVALRPIDGTYQNAYLRFVRYVIDNDQRGEDEDKYIHRTSVDSYFEEDVVTRKFDSAGASRIIQALRWFYVNLESPLGTLIIKSPRVTNAMNKQIENVKNAPASTDYSKCPQNGIKDAMSERDRKTIISHILRERNDWDSLNTSFSWGHQAGIRGASTRKCSYAEMYMSQGFGNAKEGPRASTICIILRKGLRNKDRFTTDRMVGCYRHREVLLCAVGHLSLCVLDDLRLDDDIHFLHADKTKPADWWGKSLIEFNTLDDEAGPMKQVYEATGVEGCKLTHNRTYAVQQAGSEGLAPHQINSMTKHMLEKIHKSYQSEVDKEACRVMAGFPKDEAYFVEREFLEPIWSIDRLIDLLLPKYRLWVSQHESRHGDKSPCCRRFLFEIIPYMVRNVVQDGIYLVRDFPEHVMSNYLKVCE